MCELTNSAGDEISHVWWIRRPPPPPPFHPTPSPKAYQQCWKWDQPCLMSTATLRSASPSLTHHSFLLPSPNTGQARMQGRLGYTQNTYITNIVAAFRGMHVSPAKHSYAWLPKKCDYQKSVTTGQTDRQTPDKVIPVCRCCSIEFPPT